MSDDHGTPSTAKSADYVVVARRYRPQTFDDLVGQQQVTQALKNAIETNRVGHAYLFTGARGVGKTSAARILSKCLNCVAGPAGTPCDACDICEAVANGNDVDVLEIDGASNRGIDEIRQLRSNVGIRPSRARFKVYIIDEVHMLTKEAFNALLKTLEEPPEHVKFIFCTTDPEKIPITVLSRCQRFDFAPIASESIVVRLREIVAAEGATADDEALQMLARRAGGSMRDSQSMLEQVISFSGDKITADTLHGMLGTARTHRLSAIVDALYEQDAATALAELDAAVLEGVDVGQLAEQLLGYFRDIMSAGVGCEASLMRHSTSAEFARIQSLGEAWGVATVLAAAQIIDQAIARMRLSLQRRTLVELALVRISQLAHLEDLASLVTQVRSGSTSLPAARPRAASQKKKVIPPAVATPTPTPPAPADPPPAPPTSVEEPAVPPTNPTASLDLATPSTEAAAPSIAPEATRPTEAPMPMPQTTVEPENVAVAAEASPVVTAAAAVAPAASIAAATLANAAPVATTALNEQTATSIWEKSIEQLEGLAADAARQYDSVRVDGDHHLTVTLNSAYYANRCKRPDHKEVLEAALTSIVGHKVTLSVDVKETATKQTARTTTKRSQSELIRESYEHPMVKQAMELFGADVSAVQDKKS
jgi:DNA polymerase-3 subunit gamma/tau